MEHDHLAVMQEMSKPKSAAWYEEREQGTPTARCKFAPERKVFSSSRFSRAEIISSINRLH